MFPDSLGCKALSRGYYSPVPVHCGLGELWGRGEELDAGVLDGGKEWDVKTIMVNDKLYQ